MFRGRRSHIAIPIAIAIAIIDDELTIASEETGATKGASRVPTVYM